MLLYFGWLSLAPNLNQTIGLLREDFLLYSPRPGTRISNSADKWITQGATRKASSSRLALLFSHTGHPQTGEVFKLTTFEMFRRNDIKTPVLGGEGGRNDPNIVCTYE
jgi:hypothetical protein